MTRSFTPLLVLACIFIASVASQNNNNPARRRGTKELYPNDEFESFRWDVKSLPSDAQPQFSVYFPEAGFITIADYQCPGDDFTLFVNNKDYGKTSTPLVRWCKYYEYDWLSTVRDYRYSSGRFYISEPGEYTLRIQVNAGSFSSGSGVIKARTGVCQGPPGIPSSDFALVSRLVPGKSAAHACNAFGFDLADVSISNIKLAAKTANYCLGVMKAKTQNQVFVNSWNTDTYGGTSLGLYLHKSNPYAGTVLGSDAQHHYALCQRKRSSTVVGHHDDCHIAGRSGQLAVVTPIGYSNKIVYACGHVGLIPAILSGARPDEFLEATKLVFSTIGINGRAWVGGWEVASSPDNCNDDYALHAGSGAPGGSVNVPHEDSDEPGNIKLPYLCTSPPSSYIHKRSAQPANDEL